MVLKHFRELFSSHWKVLLKLSVKTKASMIQFLQEEVKEVDDVM